MSAIFDIVMQVILFFYQKPILFPLVLIPLTAGLSYVSWSPPIIPQRLGPKAALATLGFSLLDWLMLSLLPVLNLSYAYERPLLAFMILRGLFWLGFPLLAGILRSIRRHPNAQPRLEIMLLVLCLLDLGMAGTKVYGMYIEPFRIGVTRLTIPAPAFLPDRSLRIVQLTDLHFEIGVTPRETEMLRIVEELQPDIIVLTGDYFNMDYHSDPRTWQVGQSVLRQLHAPYGVFAVLGNAEDWQPAGVPFLFDGTQITLLEDETFTLELPGGTLFIVGVSNRWSEQVDAGNLTSLMAEVPPDTYSLLLYHTPNIIHTAAEAGVDLYLAGHTHGGQIRLPFIGSLFQHSGLSEEFEMGQVQVGPTTLYVSRGTSEEGSGMPRMRLNCPPEIVLLELAPAVGGSQP